MKRSEDRIALDLLLQKEAELLQEAGPEADGYHKAPWLWRLLKRQLEERVDLTPGRRKLMRQFVTELEYWYRGDYCLSLRG